MNLDTLFNSLLQSVVFSLVGVVFFLLAFFLFAKLAPFSIRKEIEEDQNTSLGILMGSVMLGLAIIIAAAVHG